MEPKAPAEFLSRQLPPPARGHEILRRLFGAVGYGWTRAVYRAVYLRRVQSGAPWSVLNK